MGGLWLPLSVWAAARRYKGWRWALEMGVTPYLGIVP